MDGVLHKPFTLNALAQCLAGHLAASEGAATAIVGTRRQSLKHRTRRHRSKIIAGLREMSGGDNAAVMRIVALYCTHAPHSLAAISGAFGAGDRKALGAAAHALKSMSANIGAMKVYASAQEIERAARLKQRLPGTRVGHRLAGSGGGRQRRGQAAGGRGRNSCPPQRLIVTMIFTLRRLRSSRLEGWQNQLCGPSNPSRRA